MTEQEGFIEAIAQRDSLIKRLANDYANDADTMAAAHKVERDALTARVGELNAARFAYASEFALDAESQPDVGSIHQNIRALKDAARLALDVVDDLSCVGMSEVECLSVLRAIAALKAAL